MKCPGQDTRYWKPGAIFEAACPACGKHVEFFKDDPKRTCSACGHRFANPRLDLGCVAHCPYAKHCIDDVPGEPAESRENLLKDRVATAMRRYFGKDIKRIAHADQVAGYAEIICAEAGGDLGVIICAAYLHDIGIPEAEKKYNSTAARYQHQEGPPIAKTILAELGAGTELITEVLDIIGHHHSPRAEETLNFKIIYDADLIVNIQEQQKARATPQDRLKGIIDTKLFTEPGKRLARTVLLENVQEEDELEINTKKLP